MESDSELPSLYLLCMILYKKSMTCTVHVIQEVQVQILVKLQPLKVLDMSFGNTLVVSLCRVVFLILDDYHVLILIEDCIHSFSFLVSNNRAEIAGASK